MILVSAYVGIKLLFFLFRCCCCFFLNESRLALAIIGSLSNGSGNENART